MARHWPTFMACLALAVAGTHRGSGPCGRWPPACPESEEAEEVAALQTAKRPDGWAQPGGAAPARASAALAERGVHRYLPSVHEKASKKALAAVLAEGGPLHGLLQSYEESDMRKKTDGTCRYQPCSGWRGSVDCLDGQCLCQDGFGTRDRQKCVQHLNRPLFEADTGHMCKSQSCQELLEETACINDRCLCKDGLYFHKGKCVPKGVADPARETVRVMLFAGIREPDDFGCPGDHFEAGTMDDELIHMAIPSGHEHFNVSICRIATQAYHASPLPLVNRKKLLLPPEENGVRDDSNSLTQLYSVMTNRQWRTYLIQLMVNEFVYSIAMPDLSEGAKRLGNLFHTLSDSFSASHVKRGPLPKDATASVEVCGNLTIRIAMSMDVMDFLVHPLADMQDDDILFACAQFYLEATLRLWAQARRTNITTAAAANTYVDMLISGVLCPAMPINLNSLDRPAGGASAKYSIHVNRPALPRGTAQPDDMIRIVNGWTQALALNRAKESQDKQRRMPLGMVLPGRSEDACTTPSVAHVTEPHVQAACTGQLPPQYLQPYF